MKREKVCQLHETFQREWKRDFPNGPFPVLDCIDDVIKNELTREDTSFSGPILAVQERLVVINSNIDAFLDQLQREVVVKQFLIRVLDILDASIDLRGQLSTVCGQICILNNWDSPRILAGNVDKALDPVSKINYFESVKLNSTLSNRKPADRSNTLPRLCYSSSTQSSKTKISDERKDELVERAEYDEMFRKKKNITKPNDGESGNNALGAKDNFLAVKSKHIAPGDIGFHKEGIHNSPNLTRNFQLLQLTDGYDLVLGDSSVGDDKKRDGPQQPKHSDLITKPDISRGQNDYQINPLQINKKDDDSFKIAQSTGKSENITTIKVENFRVQNYKKDVGLRDDVQGSEVTFTKQTFEKESAILVRRQAVRNSGGLAKDSEQSVHNLEEVIEHSPSFQDKLRKFSSKGIVTPPPVAKKPVRSGSGRNNNKLPSSPVEGSATGFQQQINLVNSSLASGVTNSQSLQEFNYAGGIVLNRSKSEEGTSRSDTSSENTNLEVITITPGGYEVPKVQRMVQEGTLKNQSQPQVSLRSEKDCELTETEIVRDVRNTNLDELPLLSGTAVVTNEINKETEEGSEMSFYRLKKSGNSSHRNSLENLVEGVRFSVTDIQKKVEDVSSVQNVSPPEVPCRLPIYSEKETNSDFGKTDDNADCHIFVTSASKEMEDVVFDCEDTNQSKKPDIVELSPLSKKRLSSTPNYENWTINRAITISSADCFSMSDDDELDDAPATPVAASPSIEQQAVSTGSKDSGLCEDISSSEASRSDSDIVNIRGKEPIATPQVEHHTPDDDEQTLHEIVYLESDLINEVPRGRTPEEVLKEQDVTDSVDRLSVDTFSVPSDGDEEASHGMDTSLDATDSARDDLLKMRQLLVKGVLDSEKSYLGILNLLIDYKRMLEASSQSSQPAISKEDIQTIFSNIETISDIHTEFVHSLEAKVVNWTHGETVGETFKIMISKMISFSNYLNNYHQAVNTIHKCCQESDQFQQLAKHITVNSTVKEVTSLEDALFKPVQRVQRNTLVLHDLIKYTPEDHPDHHALQKALKLSHQIIKNFAIPQSVNTQDNRRLVKSSFLVEDVGGARKLRYIFLFSDVLVCTKREIRRNNKVTFEIKWFAPLTHSSIDTKFSYSDDAKASTKDDFGELKTKLKGLKRELKAEIRKSDDKDRHRPLVSLGGGGARNLEKLQKKINQTEAQLILASPKLPFKVLIEGGRSYTLLMSTDYEREEWKETIAGLSRKVSRTDQSANTMSSIYIQELINTVKETPQVNKIGNVLLKKDEDMLTGILNVTIHKVNGLTEPCDTYCNLEMDSFGHFFFKARTTICERTQDPAWNEDFDLELEGSETLRILCFKKEEPGGQGDTLLGRGALELSQNWLKGSFQEKTLSMNEISLVISMRHIPADKTMQRTPSRTSSAVFGVSISSCAKREGKTVPLIVKACVQEVERRGLDEVGIYRVSGVSSDLQNMKRMIDKNARIVTTIFQDVDIHSVTGILKLYLRELPEPLFTEVNYQNFVNTLKLSDEVTKTQCMLDLLHGLPDTNYYTIVYLLEHLVKIAKEVGVNRMSIQNLSTIFGPTLLAPATKQASSDPLEMMCKGAEEVMLQSSVINYFLGLAFSGKSLRKSAQ